MEIFKRRQDRLRQLIDNGYQGNIKQFADAAGELPTVVSRWLMSFATNRNARRISEQSARRMETKLELSTGWFDSGEPTAELISIPERWPFENIEYRRYQRLTSAQKRLLASAVEGVIDRFEADAATNAEAPQKKRQRK